MKTQESRTDVGNRRSRWLRSRFGTIGPLFAALCATLPAWTSQVRADVLLEVNTPPGSSGGVVFQHEDGTLHLTEFSDDGSGSAGIQEDDPVNFSWGVIRYDNGAVLMWCAASSGLKPGDGDDIHGMLSLDGVPLSVQVDLAELRDSGFEFVEEQVYEISEGILLDNPLVIVKDATAVLEPAQLLDPLFVESLPPYSGKAAYLSLGRITILEDAACAGDANGDGTVDPLDHGYVLARLGCPVSDGNTDCAAADQNDDGVVDPLDAGYVLARFGPCDGESVMVGLGFAFEGDDVTGPVEIRSMYGDFALNEDVLAIGDTILEYRGVPVANGVELNAAIDVLPPLSAGEVAELIIIPVGTSDPISLIAVAAEIDDGLRTKEREKYECYKYDEGNGFFSCGCISNKDDVCWDTTLAEEDPKSKKKKKRVTSSCKDLDSECDDPSPFTGAQAPRTACPEFLAGRRERIDQD